MAHFCGSSDCGPSLNKAEKLLILWCIILSKITDWGREVAQLVLAKLLTITGWGRGVADVICHSHCRPSLGWGRGVAHIVIGHIVDHCCARQKSGSIALYIHVHYIQVKLYALFINGKNETALYRQWFAIQRCPLRQVWLYLDFFKRSVYTGFCFIQGLV